MVDASGSTAYAYDVRNRLIHKLKTWAAIGLSVALNCAYDASGNLTSLASSSANGVELSYSYDPLNRLETATDAQTGVTRYGYDAVGNLAGYSYPNGLTNGYDYDALNRLTNLSALNASQTPIANYRYTVLPGGQRHTATETVTTTNGTQTINRLFSYDNTYRLTGESITTAGIAGLPASATVDYTLDDVGNRLARASTIPGLAPTSSGFDTNDRLNTDTYDANGNTMVGRVSPSAPLVTDVYDFEDRLINRNSGQVTIQYDGDGNRVAKTIGGQTTFYVVDDRNPTGYTQVLEELNVVGGSPAVTRVYAYDLDLINQDQLLDDSQSGYVWTTSYYGYDGHGSVRYLTDTTGTVTDTYDYDAFGTLIKGSVNSIDFGEKCGVFQQ